MTCGSASHLTLLIALKSPDSCWEQMGQRKLQWGRAYHCPHLPHFFGTEELECLEFSPSSLPWVIFPTYPFPFKGCDNSSLYLEQKNVDFLELPRSLQLALDSPPWCLCFLNDLLSCLSFVHQMGIWWAFSSIGTKLSGWLTGISVPPSLQVWSKVAGTGWGFWVDQ